MILGDSRAFELPGSVLKWTLSGSLAPPKPMGRKAMAAALVVGGPTRAGANDLR